MSAKEVIGYGVDPEDLATLRKIAGRLCGGTDRERDEGNLLHVIINRIEAIPLHEEKAP